MNKSREVAKYKAQLGTYLGQSDCLLCSTSQWYLMGWVRVSFQQFPPKVSLHLISPKYARP